MRALQNNGSEFLFFSLFWVANKEILLEFSTHGHSVPDPDSSVMPPRRKDTGSFREDDSAMDPPHS